MPDLVDLGAVPSEADQQQPHGDPRLHGMHPGPAVASERRVEADLLIDALPAERGEFRIGPFELRPGRGHPRLP